MKNTFFAWLALFVFLTACGGTKVIVVNNTTNNFGEVELRVEGTSGNRVSWANLKKSTTSTELDWEFEQLQVEVNTESPSTTDETDQITLTEGSTNTITVVDGSVSGSTITYTVTAD